MNFDNFFRRGGGNFFNIHATGGRGDHDRLFRGPVVGDREIDFMFNRRRFIHKDLADR